MLYVTWDILRNEKQSPRNAEKTYMTENICSLIHNIIGTHIKHATNYKSICSVK